MIKTLLLALWVSKASAVTCEYKDMFTASNWPICHIVSENITLYSGLSVDGQFLKLGMHIANHKDGWSSIAFGGNGGMKGASSIVVRKVDGEWVAEDRYSTDYVTPTMDPEQDVRLIFASETDHDTKWAVLLPLKSCHAQDYAIYDVSQYLLWALGSKHQFTQHEFNMRGQFHANLISKPPAKATVDLKSFMLHNIVMQDVHVKIVDGDVESDPTNPYICTVVDLNQAIPEHNFTTNKFHVTRFSPSLTPGAKDYVHHIILYECDPGAAEKGGLHHNDVIADCSSMTKGCQNMLWTWAVGADATELPANVGIPIGGNGNNFLVLQMHYYNPQLATLYDSSGVSMAIANQLREQDAGMFQLVGGVSGQQRSEIDGGQTELTIGSFYVPPTCTSRWTQDLTILGVGHHEHQYGRKVSIEVKRNGTNIGPLRNEKIYDFQHQSLEQVPVDVLKPGDQFLMRCSYDTSSAKSPKVSFGENTQNEMCYAIVLYYPAQAMNMAFFLKVDPKLSATFQPLCTQPSTASAEISKCAEVYADDALLFFVGMSLGISAHEVCNHGAMGYSVERILMIAPDACPDCYLTSSCTRNDTIAFGTSNICPGYCNNVGLSVYPNMSKTVAKQPTHRTFCRDVAPSYSYMPDADWPAPPQCVPVGDLTSVQATQLLQQLTPAPTPAPNMDLQHFSAAPAARTFFAVSIALVLVGYMT